MHYYWVSNHSSGQRAPGPAAGHRVQGTGMSAVLNIGARFWHLIRAQVSLLIKEVHWSITVRSVPSQKAGLWRAGRACPVD